MINYKKKLPGSTSFNLTGQGRRILKDLSILNQISCGDVVENLVMQMPMQDIPKLKEAKITGPKGGAPSLFPGKNRGTTTAVTFTAIGRERLDAQVALAQVSRGDWVELLLRQAQSADLENTRLEQLLLLSDMMVMQNV